MLCTRISLRPLRFVSSLGVAVVASSLSVGQDASTLGFKFEKGDHVCFLGGGQAERMQHDGWLEVLLQIRFPDQELSFRNLGFSADELTVSQRTAGFGSWDDYLKRCEADVVFAFFGFNESFAGAAGVEKYEADLARFVDHTRSSRYDGEHLARLVLFSTTPHENLGDPNLPDGAAANVRLRLYNEATAKVAAEKGVPFVDVFGPLAQRAANAIGEPMTINGFHLNSQGNRRMAVAADRALFGGRSGSATGVEVQRARLAVVDKNYLWFNRYRATDGYNVYGGRSSLKYTDDLSNFTVLQRELEVLDQMCKNRDRKIQALAGGGDLQVDDSNSPPILEVKTNKKGPLEDGKHEFIDGAEAIEMMTVADGMKVNLFADEKQFPELQNPVQMAWDTAGRLWVAVWPTYPHWEPFQPMNDKLLILEDTDGDGRADTCEAFADDLHNPTGFEFWNGGVVVAQCPDIMFLKDTDGDGKADQRERLLHGLSSGDTHHSANSFVLDPGGALYFQEGTFHMSQVETIYGPERCQNGCVWRFEPRTFRVERYIAYNFANPHGHVFDRWGQDFMTDGTGNVNYYALAFSGRVIHPDKHRGYFSFFKQRSRPCAATEILSSRHFPEENQGAYLIANVIGFQGIFQYDVVGDGSGFGAEEMQPLVSSTDQRFRPTDIECGPDGAVYFCDWYNPIIGHMQHHLRDPSRDTEHGRVYRLSYPDRALLTPKKVAGEPIEALLDLLKEHEDRLRYRARIELSGRDSAAVIAATEKWAAALDPGDPEHEHHLLEALWIHQQHNVANEELLRRVLRSPDVRARAAATRVLRGMRGLLRQPLRLLAAQANDENARVRLEAVVAASFFDSAEAAVVALEAKRHSSDKFLDYAFAETMRTLDPFWKKAIREGTFPAVDNPVGLSYLLEQVSEAELVKLPRTPAVLHAMLSRHNVPKKDRMAAAEALAKANGTSTARELFAAVKRIDEHGGMHARHVLHDLGMMLQKAMNGDAGVSRDELVSLGTGGNALEARQMALAAVIRLDGGIDVVWSLSEASRRGMESLLGALPMVMDAKLRATAYERVRPMMFHLPESLRPEDGQAATEAARGLNVRYYPQKLRSAKAAVFASLNPAAERRVSGFTLNVPDVKVPDAFALWFSGSLHVTKPGEYTFWTTSDDGSCLYLDGRMVVDNDGNHGMKTMDSVLRLTPGSHAITLGFYDQAGAQGLKVEWKGPGFGRQEIPSTVLSTDDTDTLRAAAVRAMAKIPGDHAEKLSDAAKLIGEGRLLEPAIFLIENTSPKAVPADQIRPLISSIAAYASGLDPEMRTAPQVLAALAAGKKLAETLSATEAEQARQTLSGLGGTTILMRTVPHQMLYDKREIAVEAGKPALIVFQNNDVMPHNLVITVPGAMERIGMAAEELVGDPAAEASGYVPEDAGVIHATGLLFPGETTELRFVAPEQVGEYGFVCTFPGHWRVMNGTLHVLEDASGFTAVDTPVVEQSDTAAVRRFVNMWTYEDLEPLVAEGWEDGRSIANGRSLFQDVGCNKCHFFQGEGVEGSVDLTKIGEKYQPKDLLQHMVDPSKEILEGWHNKLIVTRSGQDVVGRVVREDAENLYVAPDLQKPDEVVAIAKDDVDFTKPSKLSPMPTGMLVTMSGSEILDLVAFLRSSKDDGGE